MRLSILSLALFSGTVHASTPFDQYVGSIGSASLDGDKVDVTLFHGTTGSPTPLVKVTIGEDEYLMALHTSQAGVYVSERVVADQELTVVEGNKRLLNIHGKKGKYKLGGKAKNATIGQMNIGGLTLSDLNVSTINKTGDLFKHSGNQPWNAALGTAGMVDGIIGLESLPDGVSWAILPSKGEVSFATDGSTLIEGGTTVAYQPLDSEIFQYATRETRGYVPKEAVAQEGFNVGGIAMPARVEAGAAFSTAFWTEKIPTKVRQRPSDLTSAFTTITVGDTTLGSVTVTEITGLEGLDRLNGLVVGSDVLAGYDIAMDRKGNTLTLKPADTVKRSNPLSFVIAQSMKAVAPGEDEPAGGEETASAAESEGSEGMQSDQEADGPKVPGNAKAWKTLVKLHRADGDLSAALVAAENALSFDERDCAAWALVGRSNFEVGDIDSAIEAYSKSSSLYHAWYDISLEDRKVIEEELAELDGDEKKDHEHYVASSKCHTSDGHIARLNFASGDLLAIEKLYRERLDLDAKLASIAGTALVVKGEFANAQEPLRQAMKMGRGYRVNTRLALAALYAGQGNWESAQKLFDRVLETDQSIQTVVFYIDTVLQSQGQDAAKKAAEALVEDYPASVGAVFGWGYYAFNSGDAAISKGAQTYGDKWFSEAFALFPSSPEIAGARARWMSMWDASAISTQKAVRGALAKNPNNKDALLAKAAVQSAKGDEAAAKELTLKAAQLGVQHIGYATLLTTLTQ